MKSLKKYLQNDSPGEENSQALNDTPIVMHSSNKKPLKEEPESFEGDVFYDVIEEDKSFEQSPKVDLSIGNESINSLNSSPKEKVLPNIIFSHQ